MISESTDKCLKNLNLKFSVTFRMQIKKTVSMLQQLTILGMSRYLFGFLRFCYFELFAESFSEKIACLLKCIQISGKKTKTPSAVLAKHMFCGRKVIW